MSRQSHKKSSFGRLFFRSLLLVLAVGIVYIGYSYLKTNSDKADIDNSEAGVLKMVNRTITRKAVDELVSQATDGEYTLSDIKENMDQSDQETVDELLDKYSDNGILKEAVESFASNGGNVSDTIIELQKSVDSADIETFKELYEKYGTNQ
ncbi:MAG: hypothetical protein K6A23_06230 [Butyrivibrio sp.]|nr:hypothetical protein [Butyrivibrio sp.]